MNFMSADIIDSVQEYNYISNIAESPEGTDDQNGIINKRVQNLKSNQSPKSPDPQNHDFYIKRRCARLAAVQAFYQVHMTGNHISVLVDEFLNSNMWHSWSKIDMKMDEKYFHKLINGATDVSQFDENIIKHLDSDISRLDNVVLSIIRVAIYEMSISSLNKKIIMNEYIEISKAFFGTDSQVYLINGVLHNININSPL